MSSFLTYIGLLCISIIKPGPGVAFFMSVTLADGLRSGAIALLGCAISHILISFMVLYGFEVMQNYALAIDLIQAVSLLFLLWFGFYYLSKKSTKSLVNEFQMAMSGKKKKGKSDAARFAKGIVWPFTNPFNYVFYGALIPIIAHEINAFHLNAKIGVAVITGVIVFCGIFPYLLAANKLIQYLRGELVLKYMNKATGILCILIASSFLPGLFFGLKEKLSLIF